MIVEKVDLTPPSIGIICVVFNWDTTTHDEHYHIIVNKYTKCLNAPFLKIHNTNIGGNQPYVPCKYMYNIFSRSCMQVGMGMNLSTTHLESCFYA